MSGGLSPEDAAAVGALCPDLYAAVGWGAGKEPDWDAFRRCCHPQAVLVPMGSGAAAPIPLETFIEGMEGQRHSGAVRELSEREIAFSVEGFGNLANVRSTFVASIDGVDRRGVTFALIVRDADRWAILSVAWENENEPGALPADYL